jgi:hypothetical protein
LIREFERTLLESEKRILEKHIAETKSEIPKNIRLVILLSLLPVSFGVLSYYFPKIWLIVILAIISFFIVWYLFYEVSDLMRLTKFLKKKQQVIENGIVRVNEINIDRYIKINNFQDEGNHFIVEYDGTLTLIGGQEFLRVRKLKNKIEQIEILDSEKSGIYYENVKKSGKNLEPYYIFKKAISDKFVESEIWEYLTNRKPFKGKLEDLNGFIEEDKRK